MMLTSVQQTVMSRLTNALPTHFTLMSDSSQGLNIYFQGKSHEALAESVIRALARKTDAAICLLKIDSCTDNPNGSIIGYFADTDIYFKCSITNKTHTYFFLTFTNQQHYIDYALSQETFVTSSTVQDLEAMAVQGLSDAELDAAVQQRFQGNDVQPHALLDEFSVNVYLCIRPVPCLSQCLSTASVRALCIKPNSSVLFGEFRGEAAARSGHESNHAYGKFKCADGSHIYFHLVDDEGLSGYDCCGVLALTYASTLDSMLAYGMTRREKEFVAANSLYEEFNEDARKLCIPDNDELCPIDHAIYAELGMQEQVRRNLSD